MKDVFQTLFAVAWADGELRDRERTFLMDLVQRSESAPEVTGWFSEPPPELNWEGYRDEETAIALVRQAAYMAAADETVQFEEVELLERLRAQLGLTEQQFHGVLQEVEEERA
ncbi:hypothetical protein FIV42_29870 [Persicimonas caeni]|uniref:TerB family tellurite resistance protein n=1 Tax=Persicimonas caeni TaxID=2292766 RepID=A0A4Y6Q2M2_PERCE|nr:hypothetical protein [Persicimonas caeni]QDG54803.1 hypothetical protein FIV42_29870 [Persicimonas caeni]QED36024.1 hypothetical protein FRD00_29865 [Persicimonas caeni]